MRTMLLAGLALTGVFASLGMDWRTVVAVATLLVLAAAVVSAREKRLEEGARPAVVVVAVVSAIAAFAPLRPGTLGLTELEQLACAFVVVAILARMVTNGRSAASSSPRRTTKPLLASACGVVATELWFSLTRPAVDNAFVLRGTFAFAQVGRSVATPWPMLVVALIALVVAFERLSRSRRRPHVVDGDATTYRSAERAIVIAIERPTGVATIAWLGALPIAVFRFAAIAYSGEV